MNKEWVDKHEEERQRQIDFVMTDIEEYISHNTTLFQYEIDEISDFIRENGYMGLMDTPSAPFRNVLDRRETTYKELYGKDTNTFDLFFENILKCADGLKKNYEAIFSLQNTDYGGYLDSDKVEFDGDIIITDPCYVIRHDDSYGNDWEKCGYGSDMESLGINHYMTRDTIYGDWSCTTFDTDTKKPIGQFCADAGLVSVFLLDEVLKYNPDFNYHIERPWTTTLIKNFKGSVQFIVRRIEGEYEEDTEYWSAGDKWVDYSVEVVGHGVDKVTGKPINFVGKQTGL